uniref:Pecanex-like protein n=1 Tax=Macrostomum lignano TaxID=282301 RepID=A0A1I8FRL4_9PLAT
ATAVAVDPGPSAEDGLVDQLATSGAPTRPRTEPAGSRASDRQYLTDTDYVVPMRSRMMNQQELSGSEISVYDILPPSRAADENDPGGRQPIVFGSQGSAFSGVSGGGGGCWRYKISRSCAEKRPSKSPIQEADSDQEDSNIYGCPGLASTSGLEVSNPIFAGPDSDEE